MRYTVALMLAAVSLAAQTTSPAAIILAQGTVLAPGETKPLTIVLATPAPEPVIITLDSSDTSVVTVRPATLTIPAGAMTSAVMPEVTGVNFGHANVSASATGLTGDSQTVRVTSTLVGQTRAAITERDTQHITFSLSTPAATDLELAVHSDDPAVAHVPSTVLIPAHSTRATIPVTGTGTGSTGIRISGGASMATAAVDVKVVASDGISMSDVTTGVNQAVPLQIILANAAPAGGVTISLVSNNTLTAKVTPLSVFVPAGAITPVTQPKVTGVNIGITTVEASAPGYSPGTASVVVPASLSFSPAALTLPQAGGQYRVLLALSESAPWGPEWDLWSVGVTIQLTSSNPQVATAPAVLRFYPDGSSFTVIQFMLNAHAPGTTVLTATGPSFITGTSMTVTVLGGNGAPASLTATGGASQTTAVNTAFAAPLSVTVRDATGSPVPGVTVTFTAPVSGPSGSFAGGVGTAVTNSSGVATSAIVTANSIAGSYLIRAAVPGTNARADFTLTNAVVSSGAIILPATMKLGPNHALSFPVALTTPAPAGGLSVILSSADATKVMVAPATVFIAGGALTAAIQPQVSGVNFGHATITAVAAGYAAASSTVEVGAVLGFTPSTLTLNGAGAQNLTLTLSAPAPASGLVISLVSSNTSVVTVPPIVTIGANATAAIVPVTSLHAGSATITASASVANVSSATAAVVVNGASGIILPSGAIVAPGESKAFPVRLANPASAGGVFVTLTSSDSTRVALNVSNLYIPAGSAVPSIQPQISGRNLGGADITASAFGLKGDTQHVRVAATLLGTGSTAVHRGVTQQLTFVLPAPLSATLSLTLTSDHPDVAIVPATVTIPAGVTSVVVPVTGIGAGSTTVRIGAAPEISEKTVAVTVSAPGVITLPNITAALGRSVPVPFVLGTPAPAAGVTIHLASSDASTLSINPSSVFVPAGATVPTTQPQVTAAAIGAATITVSARGYVSASQVVAVPATVTFSPTALTFRAGTQQKVLLALSDSAPWGPESAPWSKGVTVQLNSSNPTIVAVPPTVSMFPDGSSFTTVVLLVNGVSPGTALIRASAPPFIPETTMTVNVVP